MNKIRRYIALSERKKKIEDEMSELKDEILGDIEEGRHLNMGWGSKRVIVGHRVVFEADVQKMPMRLLKPTLDYKAVDKYMEDAGKLPPGVSMHTTDYLKVLDKKEKKYG